MASTRKKKYIYGKKYIILQFLFIYNSKQILQVLKPSSIKGFIFQWIYTGEASTLKNCQEIVTTLHKMQRLEATWIF